MFHSHIWWKTTTIKQDDNNYNNDDDDNDYVGDYISHGYYRDQLVEASTRGLRQDKPTYFPVDDSVTRTLTTSQYSAKGAEYNEIVVHTFYAFVTRAALDYASAAIMDDDEKSTSILLT